MSLETLGLENISQVSPDPAEDPQNHNARKALPPTFSVLKRSRAIFRQASSKVRIQKVFLCPFHWEPRPSAVSLESPGLENIPQVPGYRSELGQNLGYCFSLKVKWGYISAQKLESERSKSLAVSISPKTRAIRN